MIQGSHGGTRYCVSVAKLSRDAKFGHRASFRGGPCKTGGGVTMSHNPHFDRDSLRGEGLPLAEERGGSPCAQPPRPCALLEESLFWQE